MTGKIKYEFTAEAWQHKGVGGWYFVSLPETMSAEIRGHLKWQEEGWGRLKATAQTGGSKWETAIWFDTKKEVYLLPLKAVIRKKEHIEAGHTIAVTVWV
jgi:hypothetical protein